MESEGKYGATGGDLPAGGAQEPLQAATKSNGHLPPSQTLKVTSASEPGPCAQCHGKEGAPPELVRGPGTPKGGVWLHKRCVPFWLDRENPKYACAGDDIKF